MQTSTNEERSLVQSPSHYNKQQIENKSTPKKPIIHLKNCKNSDTILVQTDSTTNQTHQPSPQPNTNFPENPAEKTVPMGQLISTTDFSKTINTTENSQNILITNINNFKLIKETKQNENNTKTQKEFPKKSPPAHQVINENESCYEISDSEDSKEKRNNIIQSDPQKQNQVDTDLNDREKQSNQFQKEVQFNQKSNEKVRDIHTHKNKNIRISNSSLSSSSSTSNSFQGNQLPFDQQIPVIKVNQNGIMHDIDYQSQSPHHPNQQKLIQQQLKSNQINLTSILEQQQKQIQKHQPIKSVEELKFLGQFYPQNAQGNSQNQKQPPSNITIENKKLEIPLVCQVKGCVFTSYYFSQFRVHQRQHKSIEGQYSFKCEKCGFQCKRISYLDQHIKINHTEKSFTCDICKRSGLSKLGLYQHKREVHSNKQYTCEVCHLKTFKTKGAYNWHLRYVHGKGIYKCEKCKYSTISQEQLIQHNRVHHSFYTSKLCDFTAFSQQKLDEHFKSKHSQVIQEIKVEENGQEVVEFQKNDQHNKLNLFPQQKINSSNNNLILPNQTTQPIFNGLPPQPIQQIPIQSINQNSKQHQDMFHIPSLENQNKIQNLMERPPLLQQDQLLKKIKLDQPNIQALQPQIQNIQPKLELQNNFKQVDLNLLQSQPMPNRIVPSQNLQYLQQQLQLEEKIHQQEQIILQQKQELKNQQWINAQQIQRKLPNSQLQFNSSSVTSQDQPLFSNLLSLQQQQQQIQQQQFQQSQQLQLQQQQPIQSLLNAQSIPKIDHAQIEPSFSQINSGLGLQNSFAQQQYIPAHLLQKQQQQQQQQQPFNLYQNLSFLKK